MIGRRMRAAVWRRRLWSPKVWVVSLSKAVTLSIRLRPIRISLVDVSPHLTRAGPSFKVPLPLVPNHQYRNGQGGRLG